MKSEHTYNPGFKSVDESDKNSKDPYKKTMRAGYRGGKCKKVNK